MKVIEQPKKCPLCNHEFKGKGWTGVDAHYKSKHESKGEPYALWWKKMRGAGS